jgi:hypothetical protein
MAQDLKDVLEERGNNYGDFHLHAYITQSLKNVVREEFSFDTTLSDVHKEALDMILHKIGRIVNGNPNYVDSWQDIAGYATLVVQYLEEVNPTNKS